MFVNLNLDTYYYYTYNRKVWGNPAMLVSKSHSTVCLFTIVIIAVSTPLVHSDSQYIERTRATFVTREYIHREHVM